MGNDSNNNVTPENDKFPPKRSVDILPKDDEGLDSEDYSIQLDLGGFFRGIAAATRKLVMAKQAVVKSTIRSVGQNRPLAFASEGAVAGESMLPRLVYYGAWTLSGVAIVADIYNKYEDAIPTGLEQETALYWTCFHVPASLVVPAMIIHRVVHSVQHSVEHHNFTKAWSPRAKTLTPVVAALLSIIPVVPAVDATAEAILEPTLGKYLGLDFHSHHHHGHHEKNKEKKE